MRLLIDLAVCSEYAIDNLYEISLIVCIAKKPTRATSPTWRYLRYNTGTTGFSMYVVNAKMTVRDAAKMTDHPMADFLPLFSMLTSSPLAAGLGFPHYYNCQRAIFSIRRHFLYSYTFSIYEKLPHILD